MTANLPTLISAVILTAVLIVTTGAMHEDGLADMADGLWGGFTPERRLEIMKDSISAPMAFLHCCLPYLYAYLRLQLC